MRQVKMYFLFGFCFISFLFHRLFSLQYVFTHSKEVFYLRFSECLFWNTNDYSILKHNDYSIRNELYYAFLCEKAFVIEICNIMAAITNTDNLRHYKSGFSSILEQILAFIPSTNLVHRDISMLGWNGEQ